MTGHVYSLHGFAAMLQDGVRLEAYRDALRTALRPGDVVVDLGCGVGVLGLLALQLGASQVYAIESADVIELARETAARNGVADRMHFIQGCSREVELPVRADVVVSDLHGVLPAFSTALADLIDARQRFLGDGGQFIPSSDSMHIAVVEAPDAYARMAGPWQAGLAGIDFSAVADRASHDWCRVTVDAEALLSDPIVLLTLDYRLLSETTVKGACNCRVQRDGLAHGLLVWFESAMAPGVHLSNRPGAREAVYGQAFFRWPRPLRLVEGDEVTAELRASPTSDRYLWSWRSVIRSGDQATEFNQAEFLGETFSALTLRRRADKHRPSLGSDGLAVRQALTAMDGSTPLSVIADSLLREFPGRFRSQQDALDFVADLSSRYSE